MHEVGLGEGMTKRVESHVKEGVRLNATRALNGIAVPRVGGIWPDDLRDSAEMEYLLCVCVH